MKNTTFFYFRINRKFFSNYKHFILAIILFFCAALTHEIKAQQPMPFLIENNSEYNDDELYIAIVGQDLSNERAHIWVDMKTGNQIPMNPSYNKIQGPEYGGNKGPGGAGMYADCFTKLSEIPNKTVSLAPIQGCRMFVGIKSQLYLYFFGSTGAQVGYASPSHTNPTDPNTGINYEIIELTYNQYGFWGNTSRVDSYNYPMGLELTGNDNFFKSTGELLSHETIQQQFLNSVPSEFINCLDTETGQIFQPTKTADFADGTVGTMPDPGPHKDYMKPYIDAIWAKYENEDLIFAAGDAGVWKGRVVNEQLVMTAISGGFTGRQGIITRRPTTQEAFEGKGVLDNRVNDGTVDLIIQAQVCAALTRHVIDVTTPNVGQQDWSDPSKYYLQSPCNHYAKFWHQQGIRVNQMAYGFAYDDVFDQSSTLHSPSPTQVKVIIGGYYTNPTSTQEVSSATSLYPNPAINIIYINLFNLVDIFDAQGRLVFTGNNPGNQIDVSNLPTGVYYLRGQNDDKFSVTSFIKK